MAKLELRTLVLLFLLLASLISLFLFVRTGARTAVTSVSPAAPQAAEVLPAPAPPAAVRKRKAARKPEPKRYKRVSTLRDPGEALIGGVSRDTSTTTSVVTDKTK